MIMRIVSVATHKERMFDIFKLSAKKHDIPLDILGMGKKWKGFGWRWKLISEHLEKIDDNELILVTDAFDTIILKNADEFATQFYAFHSPIVFSKDPNANEFIYLARYYRWRVFGEDPILNGGTYIGSCSAIKKFIKRIKYKNNTDDQRFLTSLNKMIHMTIDDTYKIMYHNVAWRKYKPMPDTCVVTFPAGGHTKKLLKHLGYDYNPKEESTIDAVTLAWRRIRHYTPFFWKEILVLMAICTGITLPIMLGILV